MQLRFLRLHPTRACYFVQSYIKMETTQIAGDNKIRFIYGIRGRKKLLIGNYTFFKFSSAKANQTWYCSQRKPLKCRASARLFMDGRLQVVVKEHTHGPPTLTAPVYEANSTLDLYFDTDLSNEDHWINTSNN